MKKADKEMLAEAERLAESISKGYWNYRLFEVYFKVDGVEMKELEIRETYYDGQDNIVAWSGDCACLTGDTIKDIEESTKMMLEALKKPVLKVKRDKEGNEDIINDNK